MSMVKKYIAERDEAMEEISEQIWKLERLATIFKEQLARFSATPGLEEDAKVAELDLETVHQDLTEAIERKERLKQKYDNYTSWIRDVTAQEYEKD